MSSQAQGPRTRTSASQAQNRNPQDVKPGAGLRRDPSRFPERAGRTAAAFNPGCALRANGVVSRLRPQVPELLAETQAGNEGDPCRAGSED